MIFKLLAKICNPPLPLQGGEIPASKLAGKQLLLFQQIAQNSTLYVSVIRMVNS